MDNVCFTFGPSVPGPLRCGCHDPGVLLYCNICECLGCGATWLLFAERFVVLEKRALDGRLLLRLPAILPDSGPTTDAPKVRIDKTEDKTHG